MIMQEKKKETEGVRTKKEHVMPSFEDPTTAFIENAEESIVNVQN